MAKRNRSTLKNFFKAGKMPSEDHFEDLIDSSLNLLEEGFDRTAEEGVKISTLADRQPLFSFYRNDIQSDSLWQLNLDSDSDRLEFSADSRTPLTLSSEGVGVALNAGQKPSAELQVEGTVKAHGFVGRHINRHLPADGKWHKLIGPLSGVQGFEVTASVSGGTGSGHYALARATALKAFQRKSTWQRWLDRKRGITLTHAEYQPGHGKIELKWRSSLDSEDRQQFELAIRSECPLPETNIEAYVTQIWFEGGADSSEEASKDSDRACDEGPH